MLRHIQVCLVGEVPVRLEPVYMVSGIVSAPQKSRGVLILLIDFIMDSLDILIHKSAVPQLVLSEQVELVNEGCF